MNPNDMTGYPTLDQVQMVASFGNAPDSVVRGIIKAAIDLYREGSEVLAWVTDDGRAIHAREKSQAIASGVAFASDARAYSIPAYTRPPSLPAVEAQTSAVKVPDEVMDAAKRLTVPLDESWLSMPGFPRTTIECDMRGAKKILAFLQSITQPTEKS